MLPQALARGEPLMFANVDYFSFESQLDSAMEVRLLEPLQPG